MLLCYFSHFQTAGKNVVDCSEVLNPENGGSSCCLQLKDSPEKYIPKSAGRSFSSTDCGGFGWPHPQYWKQTTTFVTCLGRLETSCHFASFLPASRPYRLSTAPSPDTWNGEFWGRMRLDKLRECDVQTPWFSNFHLGAFLPMANISYNVPCRAMPCLQLLVFVALHLLQSLVGFLNRLLQALQLRLAGWQSNHDLMGFAKN